MSSRKFFLSLFAPALLRIVSQGTPSRRWLSSWWRRISSPPSFQWDTNKDRRITRRESNGAAHVGRGGTGNVFKVSSDEAKAAKLARDASAVDDDSLKKGDGELGWAEKGKNHLFGKK